MTIFVVQGSTGEYSDHCEWLVKAFTTIIAASDFVKSLDKLLLENGAKFGNTEDAYWKKREKVITSMQTLDPYFRLDYTGTVYSIYEIELEGL